MFEIIVIGIAVILMIWVSIFSWKIDNGPSDKDDDATEEIENREA